MTTKERIEKIIYPILYAGANGGVEKADKLASALISEGLIFKDEIEIDEEGVYEILIQAVVRSARGTAKAIASHAKELVKGG